MDKQHTLDLYFMDARSKLIDIAAFLDRIDRADGEPDFRLGAFHQAMRALSESGDSGRAAAILDILSDPTEEPVDRAPYQGAIGAHPPR